MVLRFTRRAPPPARRSRGPLPWALAAGGLLAAAAAFAFGGSPGDSPDARRARLTRRETEARRLEREGRLDEAAALLEALAREAGGEEAFRVATLEWRAQAKTLRSESRARKALDATWRDLQVRAKQADDLPSLISCRQALAELRTSVARASLPWKAPLDALLTEVDGRIEALRVPSWTETKVRIERDCALAAPGEARWGTALERWRAYLKGKLPPADREGAERQIQAVELAARDESHRIRRRAEALSEAGRPDEGRALREAARPRFAGTAAAEALGRDP